MNEQQPYEKHIAEKFQQLPLPDVEPNWQQMKSLLNREMPRGGGYWRWITGIGILLVMLGGTWYFISHKEIISTANISEGTGTGVTEQNTDSNTSSGNSVGKEVKKQNEASVTLKDSSDQSTNQRLNDSLNTKNEENLHINLSGKTPATSNKSSQQTDKIVINNDRYQKKNKGNHIVDKSLKDEWRRVETALSNKKPTAVKRNGDKMEQFLNQGPGNDQNDLKGEGSIKNSTVQYDKHNIIAEANVAKLIGDSIKQQNYSGIFKETGLEDQRQSVKAKSTKSRNLYAGENKSLAVGFSLPLGFPLGDQKPGAYNINAKPNIISDFIPVPHLQYHINNKLYLQTEVQIMNPQYIQSVLLYQQKTELPSINTVHYNSVYAKKLYYFNIPVGIHYSPFQHFYLGTGLQFSSLVSGVALHEESSSVIGSGRTTLLSERYTKFKSDSISDRIDNSEFRLMLDANYYWKQFTVGLRYNQALSNYVSFRLNNAAPLFQDKNKSVQFYLRYNLWEDHKKKKK